MGPSQAQLDECVNHVSSDYIDKHETDATRFARGGPQDCLADAGPFCDARKRFIEEEEEAPRPGE
jgi:hypothetical protein